MGLVSQGTDVQSQAEMPPELPAAPAEEGQGGHAFQARREQNQQIFQAIVSGKQHAFSVHRPQHRVKIAPVLRAQVRAPQQIANGGIVVKSPGHEMGAGFQFLGAHPTAGGLQRPGQVLMRKRLGLHVRISFL